MTRIVTLLTDGFADWETSLLNGAGRGFYRFDTAYASPGGRPVTSMGGMNVVPNLAIDTLDPRDFDALVICGGSGWDGPDAPDLTTVARRFHDARKLVAAICDGTVALACTGLLDTVPHTGNGVGYLDKTGYGGKAHYRDTPQAVSEDGIVTAPGTSPVAFMAAVMKALGAADDQLTYYVGLHAAQYGKPVAQAA
jgi:putative intracellular protease/amidase